MSEYSSKICKSKFLSQQVGRITLGLDYKEKLLLDKEYFDCCGGIGSSLNYSTNQVSTCDIRTRFSHTVELFREYSDIFELKESYLFYESQNVDILFFHKIYSSISRGDVGALLFTGSGIGGLSRSMLPQNMDISLMSFFYGLSLCWRFGFRVHYLRIDKGAFISKKNPSPLSMSWNAVNGRAILFVCISKKSSLTDTSLLEMAINFCYNSKTFLVILDDRELKSSNTDQEESNQKNTKNSRSQDLSTQRSYFSRRISKIKSKPIFSYLDPSCESKLKELLAFNP